MIQIETHSLDLLEALDQKELLEFKHQSGWDERPFDLHFELLSRKVDREID